MSRKSTIEVRAARAFTLKNYPLAISYLSDLLECVGENPQTLYMLALCHARQNDADQAVAVARRALDADAQHLESLKLLARLLFLRGEHDEAQALVERVLRMRTVRAGRRSAARGWLAFLLGRWRAHGEASNGTGVYVVDEDRQWLEWAEAYLATYRARDEKDPS